MHKSVCVQRHEHACECLVLGEGGERAVTQTERQKIRVYCHKTDDCSRLQSDKLIFPYVTSMEKNPHRNNHKRSEFLYKIQVFKGNFCIISSSASTENCL